MILFLIKLEAPSTSTQATRLRSSCEISITPSRAPMLSSWPERQSHPATQTPSRRLQWICGSVFGVGSLLATSEPLSLKNKFCIHILCSRKCSIQDSFSSFSLLESMATNNKRLVRFTVNLDKSSERISCIVYISSLRKLNAIFSFLNVLYFVGITVEVFL